MPPRSAGPYGRVLAGAADVLRPAEMRRWAVELPDKSQLNAHGWGPGRSCYDWHEVPGHGHDGASIGQYGYPRVVPGAAPLLYADLMRELLRDLGGVHMPPAFAPPRHPRGPRSSTVGARPDGAPCCYLGRRCAPEVDAG
ncbi:hypothetical protein ABTX85_24935 [Streptomyces sp. NPDC096097]|uniref:hypothetical protein n=1 Tax=Streptomyces sp. NPDC096097 TaxID=3155546 RepID=UPI00331B63D5